MDKRLRLIKNVASEILSPKGLDFEIEFMRNSHPHVVIHRGEETLGKVKFSFTPRTDNKNFFRQNLNRWLRSKEI